MAWSGSYRHGGVAAWSGSYRHGGVAAWSGGEYQQANGMVQRSGREQHFQTAREDGRHGRTVREASRMVGTVNARPFRE
eukprot:3935382-Prymnesium_polylepis.1